MPPHLLLTTPSLQGRFVCRRSQGWPEALALGGGCSRGTLFALLSPFGVARFKPSQLGEVSDLPLAIRRATNLLESELWSKNPSRNFKLAQERSLAQGISFLLWF